jgi:RNA polymerase sigma-70 factor (ECF subfamily)
LSDITIQLADQQARLYLQQLSKAGAQAESGMEGLFRLFGARMKAYFRQHRMSEEESADLVQETFIKAFRNARQYAGDAKASTWLWAIARNCMIDHIRARKPEDQIEDDDLLDHLMQSQRSGQHERELSALQDMQDCVRRGFAHFANAEPLRASALQLAIVEGWSCEELAEHLKRTPAATREFRSQCRKKLKEFLTPCHESADLTGLTGGPA